MDAPFFKPKRRHLDAVKNDGRAIELVPENERDAEICMAAVARNGYALRKVPLEVCAKELREAAIRKSQPPKTTVTAASSER